MPHVKITTDIIQIINEADGNLEPERYGKLIAIAGDMADGKEKRDIVAHIAAAMPKTSEYIKQYGKVIDIAAEKRFTGGMSLLLAELAAALPKTDDFISQYTRLIDITESIRDEDMVRDAVKGIAAALPASWEYLGLFKRLNRIANGFQRHDVAAQLAIGGGLARLAEGLAAGGRPVPGAFDALIAAASALQDDYARAEALGGIAAGTPKNPAFAPQLEKTATAAAAIKLEIARSAALGSVCAALGMSRDFPQLYRFLIEAAAQIDNGYARTEAVKKIAPAIPPGQDFTDLFSLAISADEKDKYDDEAREETLASIARALSKDDGFAAFYQRLLSSSDRIENGAVKKSCVRSILTELAGSRDPATAGILRNYSHPWTDPDLREIALKNLGGNRS